MANDTNPARPTSNRDVKIRRTGRTVADVEKDLLSNLYYSRGTSLTSASTRDLYEAVALTVRDRLVEGRARTIKAYDEVNPKFVYYISAEYLLGRQLPQNVMYTGTGDVLDEIAADRGLDRQELDALDIEPGLGNGGLGRLAACFLDSMATLDIPAVGYGLRYEFGIFRQAFEDGWQVEHPDDWLFYGSPWEFPQPDDRRTVGFYGHTEETRIDGEGDDDGRVRVEWVPDETVLGEPCHLLVPGFGTGTVNILRLWRAVSNAESFDLGLFDAGQFAEAVDKRVRSENITKVLYPNDSTEAGRELRLKQQYFLVSCSLRDIIRRYRIRNEGWAGFPDKVVIQLNDTHPVLAIPELMRILLDEESVEWDDAWSICTSTFAYTCHTLLPEALETWPVAMFERLLPRHLEIVYAINERFLDDVAGRFGADDDRRQRMSLIAEEPERRVRMAHLAAVGSFAINGVAELHSKLLAERTLHDFAEMFPERFTNQTNGVTPRRFVRLANPGLSELISSRLGGDGWLTDLDRLRGLEEVAGDADFQSAWRDVKVANQARFADVARSLTGVTVDPSSMHDVMIKRLHEYKRQLLKALHIVTLFQRVKRGDDVAPRTFVFGAKAAPAYQAAKRIIRLINGVGETVNHDPDVAGRLNVVYVPNYNVSLAEVIIPAANLSEQISLAGTEASGTGNMKLTLNGALTIGTLDGANVEIREQVGQENFFLFGMTTDEVFARREAGYRPFDFYEADPDLRAAIEAIADGTFSSGDRDIFASVVSSLITTDQFMVLADYRAYIDAQDAVDAAWRDQDNWTRMSILNTARAGRFSSDRTIRGYCDDIWNVTPVKVRRGR